MLKLALACSVILAPTQTEQAQVLWCANGSSAIHSRCVHSTPAGGALPTPCPVQQLFESRRILIYFGGSLPQADQAHQHEEGFRFVCPICPTSEFTVLPNR